MNADALKGSWWFMLIAVGASLLFGCRTSIRSPHDFASGWVGSPIERYLVAVDRTHTQNPKKEPSRDDLLKNRYTLANGNTVYPFPVNFKRCNLHWEVNPAGIIVGYRYEEVIKGGCDW